MYSCHVLSNPSVHLGAYAPILLVFHHFKDDFWVKVELQVNLHFSTASLLKWGISCSLWGILWTLENKKKYSRKSVWGTMKRLLAVDLKGLMRLIATGNLFIFRLSSLAQEFWRVKKSFSGVNFLQSLWINDFLPRKAVTTATLGLSLAESLWRHLSFTWTFWRESVEAGILLTFAWISAFFPRFCLGIIMGPIIL